MNRLHYLLLCLVGYTTASAQQLSLFTQYRENAEIFNPAALSANYFGFEHNVSFGATYRAQWTQFTGNPTTQTLQGSYFYKNPGSFNVLAGGHLINDQTGPTGFTGLYGRLGGVISPDPYYGGISFGLNVGIVQYRVDGSDIRLREEGDVLGGVDVNQWYPDAGVGVFAYRRLESSRSGRDLIYGGISVPQVIGLDLTFTDATGEFFTKRVQHFYGMLGLYKFLRDEDTFIEPSIWFKYVPGAPINADFNLRYQMPGNFWIGTGISTASNFHFEAGFILGEIGYDNLLRVGYGFDYSFTDFGPSAGVTHEINVSYSLDY